MPGSKVCKDYVFLKESYSSRGSSPLFFIVFNIQDLPAFFTLLGHPLILLCSCFYFIFFNPCPFSTLMSEFTQHGDN